jgi:outer membrane protein
MVALLTLVVLLTDDSIPRITLADALRRSARLDPSYVAALGAVDNAEWARRSAWSAFLLPALSVGTDASKFSAPTFNIGTNRLQDVAVNARVEARYDLFMGGRKLAELSRSRAEVERTRAGELQARFDVALATERDYYQVIADQELDRVARERVRRAQEQLVIARARVVSGAAVATDSLQLLLELNRARVALLRQDAALRVARLQLGRRVGADGPVEAAPLDTSLSPELPLTLERAVAEARERGPSFVAARAAEEAAETAVRAERGSYFPQLSVSASSAAYDSRFFPSATTYSALTLSASLPLWDNGRRELALSEARVRREVARVGRRDKERGAARDVTEAYEAYSTARATTSLSAEAVSVARENFRVQETRYRAGAATILDLLEAQIGLAEAEADLVQSRFTTRLALAGLETLLGRRLFNQGNPQ